MCQLMFRFNALPKRRTWVTALVQAVCMRESRLPDELRADSAVNDGQPTAHGVGEAGKRKPQQIEDAQRLPAQRLAGQDLVNQQRRGPGHAPGIAPGGESASLAAESHQLPRVTLLAAHAQEAVLQAATGQEGVKLLLDEFEWLNALLRKMGT
jgi:hypothetical protein